MIQAVFIISGLFIVVALFVTAYFLYFNQRKAMLIKEKRDLEAEYQEQLRWSQIEVQEKTFQQIGKELHDNVGQLLSTAKMLLGLTERDMLSPPETLLTANATLGQAINELRSLSKSLDNDWINQFNFGENLVREIQRINSGQTVSAILQIKCDIIMSPPNQIILFRIVQEGIQNAIKHGVANAIHIMLDHIDNFYSIVIKNKGPLNRNHFAGLGMKNMQHRTMVLGGTINWISNTFETTVTILIPLQTKI